MTSAVSRRRVGSMEALLVGLTALALSAGVTSRIVAGSTDLQRAATVFCGVFVQALPFLVLGVLISGLVAAFVSAERLTRFLPERPAVAVALAGWGVRRCRAANADRSRRPGDFRQTAPGTNGSGRPR